MKQCDKLISPLCPIINQINEQLSLPINKANAMKELSCYSSSSITDSLPLNNAVIEKKEDNKQKKRSDIDRSKKMITIC